MLAVNKADRTSFEADVVSEAEKALAAIQANLEASHQKAAAKQEELTAPAERLRRLAAKQEAASRLAEAKAALGASQEAKGARQKAVQDAKKDLKAASAAAAAAEAERRGLADKKECLSKALTSDFELLKAGTVPALAKKALRTLLPLGKQYDFDPTLMQSFAMAGKKAGPETRTAFEESMFGSFRDAMDRQIDALTNSLAMAEPGLAQKTEAVEKAKVGVTAAEEALAAAEAALAGAQAAQKERAKGLQEATACASSIWAEARKACEATDTEERALTDLKDKLLTKFQELKEKAPEPEPVEQAEPEAAEQAAPEPAEPAAAEPAAAAAVEATA